MQAKEFWELLKDAFHGWAGSKTPRLGAALAYYAIFAIAPLFLIAMSVAGFCFGQKAASRELFGQVHGLVGRDGAEAIQSLVAAANKPKAGLWATIAALVTLGAGATGVFVELQDALNTIWRVESKPAPGARSFIRNRLLSFVMVLGIGFLLLLSLIINAGLSALGRFASSFLLEQQYLWAAVNFLVSLCVVTTLFAMILKVLPDAKVAWQDVWVGASVTALLFNLGKTLIGLYLGRSSLASAYGAAGSFIILLMWVYYSAQILFFGAEFTRVYAERRAKLSTKVPPASEPANATSRPHSPKLRATHQASH